MSRKTIFAILGIIGAVLAFVSKEFGLTIDPTAVVGTIVIALVYIFGEGKLDIVRISGQLDKFKDPKFLLALVAVIIAQLNQVFGLNLPSEWILTALSIILGILFKKAKNDI